MENHPQPEDHQWRVHEDHVAALYRLLGYTVEHNVSAGGQQVDLICEKWIEGLGITRLYIDCKHTRHNINSSVSKDDVASFIYAFRANAEPQSWTGGVMVSNRPFSQYERAAEAPVPVSQYVVMLSRMWSRVRLPEGLPSTNALAIL